jgi:antitoxin (DNA-binding transcriptional repressor) of toxin-antitoxin stability system
MDRIGIYDAKAKLSELVERVEAGEDIVLTRRGRAVVRLVRGAAGTPRPAPPAPLTRLSAVRALSKRMNLKISRAEVRRAIAKGRD